MNAEVNFHPDGLWHVVRFGYDPELVGLVNLLPSFARKGAAPGQGLACRRYYAMQLAFLMEMLGCRVTGLDPEDYDKHRRHTNGNGNDWARTLLRCVGPTRAEPVFRALTPHPAPRQPRDRRQPAATGTQHGASEMEKKS